MNWKVVVSVALFASLTGCMTYKYGGRDFRSEGDALSYQRQFLREGTAKIQPAKTKIGGTLRIYPVNDEVARTKLVTGNQNGLAADYVLKTLAADNENLRDAFEKRASFDKVELHYANGLHRSAERDVHVLYLFAESAQVNSWYYLGQQVPRTAVSVDRGSKDPEVRLMYLIEAVEGLAAADAIAVRRATK